MSIERSMCQFRIVRDSGAIPTLTIPIHMMTIFQADFSVLNESRNITSRSATASFMIMEAITS